jgi:fructose-1,6-bisphosphatase-3
MMLAAFDLNPNEGRIINGHTPVLKGESPLRAGGRIIVIDGGFCKAYQKRTGIAGYTLISNSHGMRIVAHDPFAGVQDAVESNSDIVSTLTENLPFEKRQMVADTDEGKRLQERVKDLKLLLYAYREGIFTSKYEADEEQGEY